jgi:predicted permease
VPLGFDASGLVRADFSLSPGRIANPADGDAFVAVFDPLLRRLEAVPGVTAAGLTTTAPLAAGAATSFVIVGDPPAADRPEPEADIRIVDPGYFDVMRMPLVAGRTFARSDGASAPLVMLVSETLARRHFRDGAAVGRSVTMLHWGPPITATVVGVVGDVVGQDLEEALRPTIYWHYPQFPQLFALSLFVRTERDAASVVPDVRRAIWELEPALPLPRVEPMTDTIGAARAQRQTMTVLLVGLAIAAAAFSVLGLYGVLTHQAAQQRPAHGVRLALGARRADIARLVFGDALRLAGAGLLAGAAAVALGANAVRDLLFATDPRDPAILAGAAAMLLAAAIAAAFGPAWRASRVDPLSALRRD